MEFNATFIVSTISFIVFVLIMNAIFYKPLQKTVSERQKFIDEALEEAKLHTEKSEAILADKAEKIAKTKHDAKKIILDKTDGAKSKKTLMSAEAQQNAARVVDGAKEELQKSVENAQEVLSEDVKTLAQQISSKILG